MTTPNTSAPVYSTCKPTKLSVQDLMLALRKQKIGKAVGVDDIAMEAFIYGGGKLLVHVCFFI